MSAYRNEFRDVISEHEKTITILRAEVERLKEMVRKAYNDGFGEGVKEHTTHRGGKPWEMSKWPAILCEAVPMTPAARERY